jgi:manganese transport system ATP-binding protein
VTLPAVQGKDVVLRYGDAVAVDRSTFSIPAGKITALIGPNGSGKSTLLNGIAGLLSPAAGELTVTPLPDRPRRIAYVLQTTKVNDALPITVYEVVAMGRYAGKGAYRWLRAADRTAIRHAMDRTGVGRLADRHLHELSGGQRQRVFVAQGLAQDHDVLLLDEPMTGLDLTSAQAIDGVIHDENAHGCTVVLTTHDLAEARAADHVVLLAGRVVASGSPDEVLTPANLTTAYGPSLLHVEHGHVFLDDPAHRPVPGRHVHRERSITVESPLGDEGITPP